MLQKPAAKILEKRGPPRPDCPPGLFYQGKRTELKKDAQRSLNMMVDKPARKPRSKSDTLRTIAWTTLIAVIASISTVLVAQLLGTPAPPGVAGAVGAVCAASCLAGKSRK